MIANYGFNTVVNNILSASPTISNYPNYYSPTGTYTLSADDFSDTQLGRTTWFGAMAFANYLNSISYGGSTHWEIPTFTNPTFCFDSVGGSNCGYNVATNGTIGGDELPELFHLELGSNSFRDRNGFNVIDLGLPFGIQDLDNKFDNEMFDGYWSGSEYGQPNTENTISWYFLMSAGSRSTNYKNALLYAWAITPGQITIVPEPESLMMLFAGLGLLGIAVRRNKQA
ncbi:PEP-CTERM sorting domain-containing protein [Methylophilus sp. YYY-1]|nr:PEP-CTERM sorting domain-containing protein [Methylophilus sp. YYY-1]